MKNQLQEKSKDETKQNKRLLALQGLRALAALLVVIDHAMLTLSDKASIEVNKEFAWFMGELGVSIFFVISGFVMIASHSQDFQKSMSGKFILKRIGRIIPLYYLCTAIYAAKLTLQAAPPPLTDIIASALFIPHVGAGEIYGRPVYPLGWTLQYEMLFYSIFALALTLPIKKGLLLLFGWFGIWVALASAGHLKDYRLIEYLGHPIVLYFLLGVTLGLVRTRLDRHENKWRPDFPVSLGTAFLCIALAVIAFLCDFGGAPLTATLIAAACALPTLGREHNSGGIARRVARELGDSTYSIYLTHSFILGPVGRLISSSNPNISVSIFCLAVIPLTCIVGILSYHLVEKRLLNTWNRSLGYLLKSHKTTDIKST